MKNDGSEWTFWRAHSFFQICRPGWQIKETEHSARNVYGEYLKSSALFRIFLSETFQMKNFYRCIASGSILCFLLVLTSLIQLAQVLFLFPGYLFILSSAFYKDLMKKYEVKGATPRLLEKDMLKYRVPYRPRPLNRLRIKQTYTILLQNTDQFENQIMLVCLMVPLTEPQ